MHMLCAAILTALPHKFLDVRFGVCLSPPQFSAHTLFIFMTSVFACKCAYAGLGVYALHMRLAAASFGMHRLVSRDMRCVVVSAIFFRRVLDLSFGMHLLHQGARTHVFPELYLKASCVRYRLQS